MKILVGEIDKVGDYVPPKNLIPKRSDVIESIFERSFNQLSKDGRWVFLLVSNWGSPVFEVAIKVVLRQKGIRVSDALDENVRLSLMAGCKLKVNHPMAYSVQCKRRG